MLEEISSHYPKLKDLLITLKEGFQTTIRNIVANEIKEKGLRDKHRINEEREHFSKIKKEFNDRGAIIEEQENIIESKDNIIQQMKAKVLSLKSENTTLQSMLEKHRISGIKLQDENDQLRVDIERMKKMEEDIIDKCEMFESTDQDFANALKELREQEKKEEALKLDKYDIPKLDIEKAQDIIRQKCEEQCESYDDEDDESSYEDSRSDRLSFEGKKYYSERNGFEEISDEGNSDAKNEIKALLQCVNKPKPIKQETKQATGSHFFDYIEKKHDTSAKSNVSNIEGMDCQLEQEMHEEPEQNESS